MSATTRPELDLRASSNLGAFRLMASGGQGAGWLLGFKALIGDQMWDEFSGDNVLERSHLSEYRVFLFFSPTLLTTKGVIQ